jgi:hypothetical protein
MSAAAARVDGDPVLPVEVSATPDAPLSAKYRTDPQYRASIEWRPRWAKVANPAGRGVTCHECAALQHETHGRFGPRMQPRKRRSFPTKSEPDPARVGAVIQVKGPTLLLCSRHACAWDAMDKADMT